MIYNILIYLVRFLLFIFNGKTKVIGKENLPKDEKFVLVAPHLSLLDPVFIAVTAYPHRFSFMAKKELFDIPIFSWLIRQLNAFPVDRENPGISAVKIPINYLKNDEINVVIFPTGTRHSTEIKGGAVTIARLGKSKIVPAVYSGPLTLKDLFLRKNATVMFGEPFEVKRKIDGVKDINQYYSNRIQKDFNEIEETIQRKHH